MYTYVHVCTYNERRRREDRGERRAEERRMGRGETREKERKGREKKEGEESRGRDKRGKEEKDAGISLFSCLPTIQFLRCKSGARGKAWSIYHMKSSEPELA